MLRAALAAASGLPRPLGLRAGAVLGRLLRDPLALRRSVAERNIAAAFPELDAAARAHLARRMYSHFGRMAVDILRFAVRGGVGLPPLVRDDGATDTVRELLSRGRGLLILTGHVGNWELAGAYLASVGVPVAAVVKQPSNPYVARYAAAARNRLGIATISFPEARAGVLAALRDGRAVALVADQGALRGSTWSPFFGKPTKTPEGPGLFAARSGAPVAFGALLAEPTGAYRSVFEPMSIETGGGLREVIQQVADSFREKLESLVRTSPEQYLWTHRLWRRQPPGAQPI
jgi:KDO2-lipid IV(A) lauroyltransferase